MTIRRFLPTPKCTECNEPMRPTLDAPGEWFCDNPECKVADMPVWIGHGVHPEDLA